ncbi:MAG: sigma factor, partial [Flavobacteriales bacterium]
MKVYKGINKFKGDSKLSTWMYRIAYNESINFLKLKEKKYFFSS